MWFFDCSYMYFYVTYPILQNVWGLSNLSMYCSSVYCVLAGLLYHWIVRIISSQTHPHTHTHTHTHTHAHTHTHTHTRTNQNLYQLHIPYDPEGALGSLNSIVICFLGVQAGRILTRYRDHHVGIIARFSIWGTALVRCYTVLHCVE